MIAAIAGRFADQGQRHFDRFAEWHSAVCRLRDDWAAGMRPSAPQLRDYLASVSAAQKSEALEDLIAEHLRLSWRDGCGQTLDMYFREFGDEFDRLASPDVVPASLVEDEFLARFQAPHGDSPNVEEYVRRFDSREDIAAILRSRCLGNGRYVKLMIRGQGAMGMVFEAFDRQFSRRVAIKEPTVNHAAGNGLLGHFADEAMMTAELEHPGIVAVHEYVSTNPTATFYVMRLVSGRTLGEWIHDYHEPPMSRSRIEQRLLWNRLLHSFLAVCDAMSFAHSRGVIHRDLKPGNVVVGDFGETVILDWGLGKRLRKNSHRICRQTTSAPPVSKDPDALSPLAGGGPGGESVIVGTPQYMPPEHADGVADARSDVFGLGAILYEILTARSPHAWPEGFRPADWLRQVREAQFLAPRRLKRCAPRALQAICLKALARKPADRYQSVADLTREIRRYLAGVPIRTPADSQLARAWRWLRGLNT